MQLNNVHDGEQDSVDEKDVHCNHQPTWFSIRSAHAVQSHIVAVLGHSRHHVASQLSFLKFYQLHVEEADGGDIKCYAERTAIPGIYWGKLARKVRLSHTGSRSAH